MTTRGRTKTEHGGAKNGGGYWGTRGEAKRISRKLRRKRGKAAAFDDGDDDGDDEPVNQGTHLYLSESE